MYRDFLKIDDEFSIELDTFSFSLVRNFVSTKVWRKTGEEVTKEREERWWFPKIPMCIEKYIVETAKITPTIEEYVKVLNNLETKMDQIIDVRMVDGVLTEMGQKEKE